MEEKQVKIDGLNVNYKTIGAGDVPIVLLHGWGVNSDKYIETANQLFLQTKDYGLQARIIVPDLPGFGKSDNPPEVWGVDEYVKFVREFIQSIQGQSLDFKSKDCPWIMIGHSFGGRIAIKFAAKYPEKLKALILTGAAGIKHLLTARQKAFYAAAKIGKKIFSLPLINRLEKPAEKLLYKVARERDYYQAQGVMKEVFKKVTSEDLAPCLDKIKIPTLLVWGAKDKSTPLADAEIIKLKIVNCKLEIIGEANHSLPYGYPEKFAKIITEFIKKNG